jgi:hypothetical protein
MSIHHITERINPINGLTSYCKPVFDITELYIYIADNMGALYKIRVSDGYYINIIDEESIEPIKWFDTILGAIHSQIIFDGTYTYMYISSYGNKCIYKIRLIDGYFLDKDNNAYYNLTEWISNIGLVYSEPVFDDTKTYFYQSSYDNGCIYKIRISDGCFIDINNVTKYAYVKQLHQQNFQVH